MRLQPTILKAIEAELAQRDHPVGKALLKEYRTAEERWDKNLRTEQNYSIGMMERLKTCGKRVQQWYEAKLSEAAKRKGE